MHGRSRFSTALSLMDLGFAMILGFAVISSVGCTDRINTASLGANSTLAPSPDASEGEAAPGAKVDRFDWLRLAQRVGLRGGSASQFDRLTGAASGPRRQFVSRPANGSFPYAGNQSYPAQGGNLSFPGGNYSFPANSSFPYGNANSSLPGGGNLRWFPGGRNTSLPYGSNSSFPTENGNISYGQGRFFPPRGAGSRGLPLNSPNVTYGQGFPGFPGGGSNSTLPR